WPVLLGLRTLFRLSKDSLARLQFSEDFHRFPGSVVQRKPHFNLRKRICEELLQAFLILRDRISIKDRPSLTHLTAGPYATLNFEPARSHGSVLAMIGTIVNTAAILIGGTVGL